MAAYQLNTDTSQIELINNNRVMVVAALVYLYTVPLFDSDTLHDDGSCTSIKG